MKSRSGIFFTTLGGREVAGLNDLTVRSELVEGVMEGVTEVVDTISPVETDLAAAASGSSPVVADEHVVVSLH